MTTPLTFEMELRDAYEGEGNCHKYTFEEWLQNMADSPDGTLRDAAARYLANKRKKHTPGNWHEGQGNGEGYIFADEGRMRLEEGGTTLYPICQMTRGFDEEEDAANARLIKAAPQLLNALQLAEATIMRLNRHNSANGTLDVIRAAIAQAE